MARRDKAAVLRRQKDAKQKKLLIVLVPAFLGLAAWQGPPTYKALFSSSTPPPLPPAQTTPTPTDPAAPPTTQGGTSTVPATGGLVDTDPSPSSGLDRLISFSRFTARDPFKVTVGQTGAAVGTGTDDSGSSGSGQQATSALLEVNGSSQSVAVGDSFPAADPTFELVSLTSDKAVVGLVSGTFEGGQQTVEISVGEQVQLVADDGASYTIKLVSVGS